MFSIAFAVTQIIGTARDFGIPQYIVQEKELTAARVKAAQTVSIIISWALGLCLALISGPAADFYQDPRVRQLVLLLSLNFVLLPFGQVSMGYLQKTFQFQKVMAIGIASAVVSAVTVVCLAMLGYGALSMAVANIAGSAVTVAGAVACRPRDVPMGLGLKDAGRILSFGTQITLIHAMYAVGARTPSLMIAKLLSFSAAGSYERASSLVEVFNTTIMQAVWKVTLPIFSRDSHDLVAVRGTYLKVTAYLTGIGFPFFIFLAVLSPSVIHVLLGPKWSEAAAILTFLALSGAVNLCIGTSHNLLTALGRVAVIPRIVAAGYLIYFPLIGLLAPFGIAAIGGGVLVATVLAVALTQYLLRKEIPIVDLARILARSFAAALPVLVVALGARFLLPPMSSFALAAALVGVAAVCAAAWFVVLRWVRHPLCEEITRARRVIAAR
ncbi:MAG: oligosaccharide flippase family protein [Burkholderiales bacterium]|nr:oligosaccharide flippase family protein [Burkholderiales bacterium]